jgi:hypothetical protein
MSNNLKYDPLHIYETNNSKAAAIDNILSMKMETDLGKKIISLMKELVETDDEDELVHISMMINNVQADIKDIQIARNERLRKVREKAAVDNTNALGATSPLNTPEKSFPHIFNIDP